MIKKKDYANNSEPLDIEGCRKLRPYSNREYLIRFLWLIIQPLFSLSPRSFFFWRVFLLRCFGAKIGRNVHIYPSAMIYMPWNLSIGDNSCIGEWSLIYNLGLILIGKSVTISHKVHLCSGTHDYKNKKLPLIRKKIYIRDYAWVCTDVFIGPGCLIGEGAILGARSVVLSDINSWEIVGGNPAKFIKKRSIN